MFAMYRPTTRVLALLELLQTHGRMSGAELAPRLGVDRRTLRRYVGKLEDIGIPIMAERGRAGGYALMPGFKLPPMMFTEDETLALSLGLLAARGLGLAEAAPAVASAQAKLERIMPDQLRQRVRAVGETVKLEAGSAAAPPKDRAGNRALVALTGAAQACRRVVLHYRNQGGDASVRRFDPFGVAFRHGRWYTVGMCHLRNEIRIFRLDRIAGVEALAEAFERPAGFDAMGYLVQSLATLPRAFAIEVLLKTDLASARAHLFVEAGVFEETAEGVVIHNQSDELEWFARQLAGMPFDFEIRHPPALHAAVEECVRRLQRCSAAPG
ncbi:helix-turn-helix transcriptional regulator [Massilia sp. LXY-6]|uniref:helix-turn-helix transcriptional regulator n=1 Tax=Massilia sp. LXY-6 TaxID=3379823 RepID=UPI003EDEEB0E